MILPALRGDLDLMPSPAPEQPGLLIRDPLRYSDAVIVVPWILAPYLDYFDGAHDLSDLREALVRDTGQIEVSPIVERLTAALQENAFLHDDHFVAIRQARETAFAAGDLRLPSQAGSGYPDARPELDETMRDYIDPNTETGTDETVVAIAAPHVSPFGGWQSYRAAYRKLPRDPRGRTFVILGTSHYGEPDKFALTRKSFQTPLGVSSANQAMVNRLAERAPAGVTMEDYCHAVEHSIEFQVLFLQWLYGPGINILPILCGSFARSIYFGGAPEEKDGVRAFLSELADLAEREKDNLLWVLGIDMAHIGRRYGDQFAARAHHGYLAEVAERDRLRNERVIDSDAPGFWDLVQNNRDDLRWCGSSPLYTFLKAAPFLRGTVERYEQWNIDDASVVSFAGLSFRQAIVS